MHCVLMTTYSLLSLSPLDVNLSFPKEIAEELVCISMLGSRMEEAAFVHKPSRTLILCDLAFHLEDVFSGLERSIMKWNLVGVRFGPSKLTRILFATNKIMLKESYESLFAFDFDRVIVNHGEVLETGGKELLRASVREVFG